MAAALPKKEPRPAYFVPVTVLILLVATLFRAWDLAEVSLWGDENFSLIRAELPFADMMQDIARFGTQVPLYFIVVRIFPADNQYLLRLPALFTALLGIAAFIVCVYRLYGRPQMALWAGALLAFNPYHIWLSRQARFYPLLFLLTLLSSFFFLAMIHRRRSTLMWVGFTLATAGAYLTHYFGVVLPIAQYLYMFAVVRNDRRFFIQWFAAQGLALAPATAWFIHSRSQPEVAYLITWIPQPETTTVPTTILNLMTGFTGTLDWYFVPLLLIGVAGLVAAIVNAIRRWKSRPIDLYWIFLLFVPVLLIYIYVAGYLTHSIYMDRYFMGVLPGAILLMLSGWYSLGRRHQTLLVGLVTLFLMFNGVTIADTISQNEHEMYDFTAAAEIFEQRHAPGEGVMFIQYHDIVVFERYYALEEQDDILVAAALVETQATAAGVDNVLARQEARTGITLERIWVLYRNPEVNPHRTLSQPDWDPFAPNAFVPADTGLYDWLLERRDDLIYQTEVTGYKIFLFDYAVPDYARLPYPAP